MLSAPRRHRRREQPVDGGFTLMELVIAIGLLGVVMTAMTAAILAALKSNSETEDRLDRSNSLSVAATYFGDDVAQANDIRVAVPEQSCADNPAPATAVVQFWNRQVDISGGVPSTPIAENSPVTSRVSYVLKTAADPTYRELHRRTCGGGVTRDVVIARALSATSAPVLSCWDAVPGAGAQAVACGADTVRHIALTLTPTDGTADAAPYTLNGTTRRTT